MENEENCRNFGNDDKENQLITFSEYKKHCTSSQITNAVAQGSEEDQSKEEERLKDALNESCKNKIKINEVLLCDTTLNDSCDNECDNEDEQTSKTSASASNALLATNAGLEKSDKLTEVNPLESVSATNANPIGNDNVDDYNTVTSGKSMATSVSTPSSVTNSPSVRYSALAEKHNVISNEGVDVHNDKMEHELQFQKQLLHYEQQLEQLKAALQQKDNMIALFQRENTILEKEKEAFRKEKDYANKEKETTVIKFAMKEKSVIDARKEKELVEKQLVEARKELKNYSTKLQALNEEKSRVSYLMDEKCNEVRKYQRECEKIKSDYSHLESKLKYHINKLNMECEAKLALEKKLNEEKNSTSKLEEKANEQLRVEFEAQTILLKHEITKKTEQVDKLFKDSEVQKDIIKQLQDQLSKETKEKLQLQSSYAKLQEEHNHIQNLYSAEMLNSAKYRGQLEELQVLKTQNTLNEDKIYSLTEELKESLQKLQDNEQDLHQLRAKEHELLTINKEMSESIVDLQNEICLLKSKAQGTATENELLKRERLKYDEKYAVLETQLKNEQNQKNEERLLLAKHLSEKTKLYENTKIKYENILGDFEAAKHKHVTIVKELQREIVKLKRAAGQNAVNNGNFICSRCGISPQNSAFYHKESEDKLAALENSDFKRSHSRENCIPTGPRSVSGSWRESESSESDTVTEREADFKDKEPSRKHLVERILRLQQASARQTEKIDFLEQHTLSLVAELQKKSKVVQYYMLRDQAGALTSSKSDQNKSELAKYGNGVMSAIYAGIKGVDNKSMSLELSLEINRKLQAVLEDTLLKNITLKENLDVLGLEVDNLTRKLRQVQGRQLDQ